MSEPDYKEYIRSTDEAIVYIKKHLLLPENAELTKGERADMAFQMMVDIKEIIDMRHERKQKQFIETLLNGG